MALEQRPYQERIIGKTLQAYQRGLISVLIESPCGSGKTYMALRVAKQMAAQGMRIGWVALRRNLLTQAADENARTTKVPIQFISLFQNELPDKIDFLVFDEAHHTAAPTCVSLLNRTKPKAYLGMSVGEDSMILIRQHGLVRHMTIGEFYSEIESNKTKIDECEVRAFDGQRFGWKPLKAAIKHKVGSKAAYRINASKGRSLTLTEDHSIYAVVQCGKERRKTPRSVRYIKVGELVEKRGSELRVGDFVLLEDAIDDDCCIREIDISQYLSGGDWSVAGDFGDWIVKNVTRESGYHNAHKIRYDRRFGYYGPYVNASEFRKIPNAKGRIYKAGRHSWCMTHIPVRDLAYVLGFYIGDGWLNGPKSGLRLTFAVENKQLASFLEKLRVLSPHMSLNPRIRKMRGGSVEVRISNRGLTDLLNGLMGRARSWEKRIPSIAFSFCKEDARLFVQGMLDSDGSLSSGRKRHWSYTTTSERLATEFCELLKKIGVIAGISSRKATLGGVIQGRQIRGRHKGYNVTFSDAALNGNNEGVFGHRRSFVLPHAGFPVKIRSIEKVDVEYVYDLSVDDDKWQTFVASGILVHNSATPMRTDRMQLSFQKVIKDAGIHILIQQGYLAPYHHFVIPEYNAVTVAETYLRERERWGKTMAYFLTINECFKLKDLLTQEGVRVEVVTADSDRESQIEKFRNGDVDFLANVYVLTEGFDCCPLKTIFVRPSGRSPSVQMCGRVFRKHESKEYAQIVQCRNTRFAFPHKVKALAEWVWVDGMWRSVLGNENVAVAQATALRVIANSASVKMPLMIQKSLRSRRRRNQGESLGGWLNS